MLQDNKRFLTSPSEFFQAQQDMFAGIEQKDVLGADCMRV